MKWPAFLGGGWAVTKTKHSHTHSESGDFRVVYLRRALRLRKITWGVIPYVFHTVYFSQNTKLSSHKHKWGPHHILGVPKDMHHSFHTFTQTTKPFKGIYMLALCRTSVFKTYICTLRITRSTTTNSRNAQNCRRTTFATIRGHIVFQGVEPFIKCVRHANSTEILAATLCVRSTIDRRRWKVARDYIDWKKEKLIWAMTINVWKNSRRLFGCLCVVFDAHRAVAKQNWALSSELSVEKRKLCSSRRLDWRRRRRRETPGRYFALPQWWSTHTHKRNIYTRENPVYRVVSRVWQ